MAGDSIGLAQICFLELRLLKALIELKIVIDNIIQIRAEISLAFISDLSTSIA